MAAITLTGASLAAFTDLDPWDNISWHKASKAVFRLQVRIAKAIKEGRIGKVKALQRLLTHSFAAKALAVKRVTENTGSKTPGVDGIIWKTSLQKIKAVKALVSKGYKSLPLRRIYIPKKSDSSKVRPLGIPTIFDRAMQALHLLALEPVAETTADINSYGFRPNRSCADAIEQCFISLARKTSAIWIFEGDIRACFDKISHSWIKDNVLMDCKILDKCLKSGYIEKKILFPTNEGTPAGGIISPTIANIVLDGLETLIKKRNVSKPQDKVNFVRYADDFVITGNSKELLENKIKPVVESFLKERGLELSQEKTKITNIEEGSDFLGFNIRKYSGKLLIKPAKKNVLSFIKDIKTLINENKTVKTEILIHQLNARIRGWANYYRHAVSKRTFSYVADCIFKAIAKWIKRRHPNKSSKWLQSKYFRKIGLKNWVFTTKILNKTGKVTNLDLFAINEVKIKRHVKIRSQANMFDPHDREYFEKRKLVRN